MTNETNAGVGLVRGGGIAVWRRIADRIEAEIADANLAEGAKLPTEAELSERFGVNRHTVRRALAALAADGVVAAERGRGTFVGQPRILYPIGPNTRFSAVMGREGHTAGGELTAEDRVAAEGPVAARLRVEEGAPLLRVRLKRFRDALPISVSTSWLPLPRFGGFAEAFRATGAVTPALAACGVGDYRRSDTRITARGASGAEVDALALDAERVVLVTSGLNVDLEGVPVQLTEAVFAAARIELVVGDPTQG